MPFLAQPARSRLRATTSLSPAQVKHVCLEAAAAAKGDLWNGRQRVRRTSTTPKADVYEVRDALGTRRLMLLRVVTQTSGGRTNVRVDVEEAQLVAPSRLLRMKETKVLAGHTLRQFLAAAADGIRAGDAAANVKVRADLEV